MFYGYAQFWSLKFASIANFKDVAFSGGVCFSAAEFSNEAWFHAATFPGGEKSPTEFEDTKFSGTAHFVQTSGPVSFERTKFDRNVRFHAATFGTGLSFKGATILGEAYFPECRAFLARRRGGRPHRRGSRRTGHAGALKTCWTRPWHAGGSYGDRMACRRRVEVVERASRVRFLGRKRAII